MKALTSIRADGSRRNAPRGVAALGKAERIDGVATDTRSVRYRRMAQLVAEFGRGLDLKDEVVAALARSAAILSIKIESMSTATLRGHDTDALALNRMIGTRTRCLEKLDELRQRRGLAASRAPDGTPNLAAHLARMAREDRPNRQPPQRPEEGQ